MSAMEMFIRRTTERTGQEEERGGHCSPEGGFSSRREERQNSLLLHTLRRRSIEETSIPGFVSYAESIRGRQVSFGTDEEVGESMEALRDVGRAETSANTLSSSSFSGSPYALSSSPLSEEAMQRYLRNDCSFASPSFSSVAATSSSSSSSGGGGGLSSSLSLSYGGSFGSSTSTSTPLNNSGRRLRGEVVGEEAVTLSAGQLDNVAARIAVAVPEKRRLVQGQGGERIAAEMRQEGDSRHGNFSDSLSASSSTMQPGEGMRRKTPLSTMRNCLSVSSTPACPSTSSSSSASSSSASSSSWKIRELHLVAHWRWIDIPIESKCVICDNLFGASCPTCKGGGELCPPAFGKCSHIFHLHCIVRWLDRMDNGEADSDSSRNRGTCPFCRQPWQFVNAPVMPPPSSSSDLSPLNADDPSLSSSSPLTLEP